MQAKIRELYKASQESQAAAAMMGQGGQPINPYPGKHYRYCFITNRNAMDYFHFVNDPPSINVCKISYYFQALTTQP